MKCIDSINLSLRRFKLIPIFSKVDISDKKTFWMSRLFLQPITTTMLPASALAFKELKIEKLVQRSLQTWNLGVHSHNVKAKWHDLSLDLCEITVYFFQSINIPLPPTCHRDSENSKKNEYSTYITIKCWQLSLVKNSITLNQMIL